MTFELLILFKHGNIFKANATYLLAGKTLVECKHELDRLINKRILNTRCDSIKYLIRNVG